MKKTTTITTIALLAALSGLAQAQTAAPATQGTDPIVQMRTEKRDANQVYREATTAARKERDAKVNAAVAAAAKDAKASGKDPLVAKREARSKARAATQADFDAKMKAARHERDTARAAAQTAASTTKP